MAVIQSCPSTGICSGALLSGVFTDDQGLRVRPVADAGVVVPRRAQPHPDRAGAGRGYSANAMVARVCCPGRGIWVMYHTSNKDRACAAWLL